VELLKKEKELIMEKKIIFAVSLGPGGSDLITPRALDILEKSDTVAGYINYIRLFPELFKNKKIISNGMRGEIERCEQALKAALEGEVVSVISSGDAGVYAMAGLLMELTERDEFSEIEVEVVPGITAASTAASILGAPLMNDFAVISLSDLMTPQEVIIHRIQKTAEAGFVCAVYNPASRRRQSLIKVCIETFMKHYGPDTYVGIVKNAARANQESLVSTLGEFPYDLIDMNTILIIGNRQTVFRNKKMYTLRGYSEKYGKKEN